MKLTIPELSLVVLVGASGSGKSTFARKHFKSTEILSSDFFRAMLADDESDQNVNSSAFELLHLACTKRLLHGKLTVIDATNVQVEARRNLLDLARRNHVLPGVIVFNLPEALCHEQNQLRTDRQVPNHVIRNHTQLLKKSLDRLRDEGFRFVHILSSREEMDLAVVDREPLHVNRRSERGPFDIIGDIHGCMDELKSLLVKLGYSLTEVNDIDNRPTLDVHHPAGRKLLFVGDLVDRGPDTPGVLRLVMKLISEGKALSVKGNHDDKLLRKLKGREVSITHGLAESLSQLDKEPPEFMDRVRELLEKFPTHYLLDEGKLVVAHAGLKAELQGRVSDRVRAFCLYGETTGESDEFGMPVRGNWAADYRGRATVVYGHTPVLNPEWINRCICIDTGCVFGGALTALRYPENEIISVPALKEYCEAKRPIRVSLADSNLPSSVDGKSLTGQQIADDVLDLADVIGKRTISTRLMSNIIIREGHAAAALEAMSRFAVDPHWLIYLPPTMSPCETSSELSYLEHPQEAFTYFARQEIHQVVCEQKHMGSRAVVIICRDEDSARKRFGVIESSMGVCLSRTGRKFFDDPKMEKDFLQLIRSALDKANWWDRFQTTWFCIDGELMPWSAKAQALLKQQYAATGSAALGALPEVLASMTPSTDELQPLRDQYAQRLDQVCKYIEAYQSYCWPVNSIADLRFAPFHLLASEGTVHIDKDHAWHMTSFAELERFGNRLLKLTPYRLVDLSNPEQVSLAIKWWMELTESGSEGMVVKPLQWINRGKRGLVQAAIKVRGPNYLRIIYGPEYLIPENLQRLRSRGLGLKQSLALKEFALGIESLERFVKREPLRKVHECCFAILALESELVDPRL